MSKVFDLGNPYGKVTGSVSDPWDVIGGKINVSGSWWPGTTGADARKSWQCMLDGYIEEHEWRSGPSGAIEKAPAYAINNGGFHYAMRPADVAKLLPKNRKPPGWRDDDEVDGSDDEDDGDGGTAPAPVGGRGRGRGRGRARGGRGGAPGAGAVAGAGRGGGGAAPAVDTTQRDARPWAKWAGVINETVSKLHGDASTPPSGWTSRTKADLTEPFVVRQCTSTYSLKDPAAQGIRRTAAAAAARRGRRRRARRRGRARSTSGRGRVCAGSARWPAASRRRRSTAARRAVCGCARWSVCVLIRAVASPTKVYV